MGKEVSGKKPIRGTREWAVAEINCCRGCPHGCRYCYARYDLVERQGVIPAGQWFHCRVNEEEVEKSRPLYPGQVMFPSAHDIVPDNLEACLRLLKKILAAGNRVLVVSKPHLACIQRLCAELADSRKQLLFRFTITARNEKILTFWEPYAPGYAERKACLEYAFAQGFSTSVSVEPMLDTADVAAMVHELLPFINHSIWLGKMNKIARRVACDSKEMQQEIARIEQGQTDGQLHRLYRELRATPEVRWKESIKEVVGLKPASEPGLDV